MILEDGREIRLSDRIEVWDARRCVRVLRPAANEDVRLPSDLAFAEGAFVSLAGLVVLIVGGTRGIGLALAEACRVRGADVVACGRAECDVTDASAVGAFVDRHPRIDVVVQCAALAGRDDEAFADVLATNVTGAFHVARALLDRGARARFIGVSSGVTDTPVAGAPGYVASKHGLEGLVRALACESGDITFTAVQLGACASPREALPALLHAIVAPAGDVHGRILSGAPEPRGVDTSGANAFVSSLGASPRALDAIARAAAGDIHFYPDTGATALREAIADRYDVAFDRIVAGAGASDLLERALRVLVRRGESVVANAPSWPLFPELCRRLGIVVRRVPYVVDREARRIDHALDAMLDAIDRSTRAVYLVSPSNPMGVALDRDPFARFLERVPAHVTIIVDEAYVDYVERPEALRAHEIARKSDNVVVLRSFSKLHGLASLRVGYAIAAPSIAERLANAGVPFAVSGIAQAAARAALEDEEHAAAVRAEARDARARAGPRAFASDAPFFFIDDESGEDHVRRRSHA